MAISERIKELRKHLNLTQTEFGDKIGLKQNNDIDKLSPMRYYFCDKEILGGETNVITSKRRDRRKDQRNGTRRGTLQAGG